MINLFPDEVQIAIALGDFVPDNTVGKRAAVKKEPANAGSLDLDLIFQERGLDLDYMQKVLQDYNQSVQFSKSLKERVVNEADETRFHKSSLTSEHSDIRDLSESL